LEEEAKREAEEAEAARLKAEEEERERSPICVVWPLLLQFVTVSPL